MVQVAVRQERAGPQSLHPERVGLMTRHQCAGWQGQSVAGQPCAMAEQGWLLAVGAALPSSPSPRPTCQAALEQLVQAAAAYRTPTQHHTQSLTNPSMAAPPPLTTRPRLSPPLSNSHGRDVQKH